MKILIVTLSALTLALSLTACGGNAQSMTAFTTEATVPTDYRAGRDSTVIVDSTHSAADATIPDETQSVTQEVWPEESESTQQKPEESEPTQPKQLRLCR